MELLKAHNWMPWKRRMLAVLRDLGLEKYIAKDAKSLESAGKANPTTAELEEQKKWKEGDAKARTRIELSIGDAEMIHISGADSAREMWDQLTTVKESKGRLGVLATRRALYRMTANEGFDMVEHISKLRKLQEELHLMDNKVPDEDFVMILITSLPESWDQYTSAYLGSSSNKPTLRSHELIAILLEEDRRRRGRSDDTTSGVAMQAKFSRSENSKKKRRSRNASTVGGKAISRKNVGLKEEDVQDRVLQGEGKVIECIRLKNPLIHRPDVGDQLDHGLHPALTGSVS